MARRWGLALAPVLLVQGLLVRRRTPTLPEAAGPRHGSAGAGEPLQVVVLGESTAAGVGVDRMADALAAQFARELAARTGRQVRWTVSARTGATAAYARHALLPAAVREPADLALVVLGVNDTIGLTGRAKWRHSVETIVADLRATGGRVLLAGVPDLGTFTGLPQPLRGALGQQARMLDGELQALADGTAVLHAPMPPLDGLPAPFARDNFHPSAQAYRVWGAQLADVAAG
jgi:lysophospholipase L1-like esterase